MINTFTGCEDAWKTQVALILLFISSNDTDGEWEMYLKSEKDTVITNSNTNDLLKVIVGSLLTEYKKKIFKKMRGSGFIFDREDKTYQVFHKIALKRVASYIKSTDQLKLKKQLFTKKNDEEYFI